jgi:Ca2+-binding RTX toxin-like protein
LTGQGDNDWLFGGAGNDSLTGGNGSDLLYGGAGVDVLTGSNNADTFVFGDGWNSGVDTIADFIRTEGDNLLLVNDQQGLFTGCNPVRCRIAIPLRRGRHECGHGRSTRRLRHQHRQPLFDSDGAGGNAAVLFATFSKVGGTYRRWQRATSSPGRCRGRDGG